MEVPYFLTIGQYALSRAVAEQSVELALKRCGYHKPPKQSWGEVSLTITRNGSSEVVKFHQLVRKARLSGIALEGLQEDIDNRDPVFGGSFSLATPNYQMEITTSFAGYERKLKGPCRSAPVEQELAEDILFFRKQVCENSNSNDFLLTCRYYRAYIFSAISLVDAFINRHILWARFNGVDSPEFQQLTEEFKLENKIELWLKVFPGKELSVINKTKEWNHFKLLKEERNMITHAVEPFYGHEMSEVSNYLNYVRTGIGGLLSLLRRVQNLDTLGFIEKLRTAPKVTYEETTLRADGNLSENSVTVCDVIQEEKTSC